MRTDSIALRLAGLFALVAVSVFVIIGGALYRQVDKSLDVLPNAELEARYSVLESAISRFGDPEHWGRLTNKLNLLSEEDKRIHFWVVSGNPTYEYGAPGPDVRRLAQGPLGIHEWQREDGTALKVLVSTLPGREQRPSLRFLIGIDVANVRQTHHDLAMALIACAALGVILASLLGYWVARIGLRPLRRVSRQAQQLAPPRLSGRLRPSHLPPELEQLVEAFNAALERVEGAYQRLESFNADVAHELRSPLTNLIGQTQVALTRGRSAEHYFEVLQSNLEDLERLRSIVNDMLFLARADQGSRLNNLESSSLAAEVAASLDYLDFILEDAGIQVTVEGDAQVQVDRNQLRRALINLLHNAAQHSEAGQRVRVAITVDRGMARVSVSNPGPPIHGEYLPLLFERFFRVDTARHNEGGNHGLGLAIVKAIATMHGGNVFARSEGGANTFGLDLPLTAIRD
ncbi:heavy metal sensor histidine kinase [Pseudomonas massiliensis]|uniref:heavy metal sensor histidine kinase n=1 Tax=Pseudomonas massiliensis TaxID=522492 RepID=UPI00058D334A|nr:heavy metal sensor histidine kinase [Pseudomonas massiliensis]